MLCCTGFKLPMPLAYEFVEDGVFLAEDDEFCAEDDALLSVVDVDVFLG